MNRIGLIVGGQRKELAAHSISELISALELPPDGRGIAIAVNDTVVSRSRWHEHKLDEGDRIEIVRAVQGG